jgi:peptidoglycan/xylan/chitin deacetylase (PgdA/CDA1 family)
MGRRRTVIGVSILCYHAVDPGWTSAMSVPPDQFTAHCAWLARSRRVVPLNQAVALMDSAGRLPRGLTALTFDDGFRSLAEYAAPILERSSLPWTVFLVAETLTPEGHPVDWVRHPTAHTLETLHPSDVLALRDRGVSFGSHSLAHRDLTTLSDAECEADLRRSRELLETLLEGPVPYLAYPGGRNDERVQQAAARAGYERAFTLPDAPEPVGPFSLPRVGVYPGNRVGALRIKTARWYLSARTSRAYRRLRPSVTTGPGPG